MTKRMLKRYFEKYKHMFNTGNYATVYSVYKELSYRKTSAWENLLNSCRGHGMSRPIVLAHSQFTFSAGYVHKITDTEGKHYLYFVYETAYATHELILDESELSFVDKAVAEYHKED